MRRIKLCLVLAFAIALGGAAPAWSAARLIDDPAKVASDITGLVANAKPDDAVEAISQFILVNPSTQFNFAQLTAAFKLITSVGAADLKDMIGDAKHGGSIEVITYYLHFPPSENSVNQFVFMRYTFMKTGRGWVMTYFDFKTSGVFPPSGWTM